MRTETRSHKMLETRGFTLYSENRFKVVYINRFREWKLEFDMVSKSYQLYNIKDNTAVVITPKIHKDIMIFMEENWWFDYHKTKDIREMYNIGLNEMSKACKVSKDAIRNFEMGAFIPTPTKLKIYEFYIKRGIDL